MNLTCEAVLELYTDYLEGAMGDEQRAQVDTHLRGCTKCADDFKFFQTLVTEARALEPAPVPLSLRSNVRAALSQRKPSWIEKLLVLLKRPATISLAGVTACVLLVAVAVHHNPAPPTRLLLERRQADALSTTAPSPSEKKPTVVENPTEPMGRDPLALKSLASPKPSRSVERFKETEQIHAAKRADRTPAPPPLMAEQSVKAQGAEREVEATARRRSGDKENANLSSLGGNAKGGALAGGFGGGGGGMGGPAAAPAGAQSNIDSKTFALKIEGATTQAAGKPMAPAKASPEGKPGVTNERKNEPSVLALGVPAVTAGQQRGAATSRPESPASGTRKDDAVNLRRATASAGATNTASSPQGPALRTLSQQSGDKEKQNSLNYFGLREMPLAPVEELRDHYQSLGQVTETNRARYNRAAPSQNQNTNVRSQAKSGVNVTASVRGALEVGENTTLAAEVQSSIKILDVTIQIEAPNEIEFVSGNSIAKGTVTVWSGTILPNDPVRTAVGVRPRANGKHLLSVIIRSDERGVLARRTFALPVGPDYQVPQAGAGAAAKATKK